METSKVTLSRVYFGIFNKFFDEIDFNRVTFENCIMWKTRIVKKVSRFLFRCSVF
jgi:hypothetical protein